MSSSDFKNTDLDKLAKEAIAELEMDIEKTGGRIEIGNLPVLSAIPGLMRQLFYNLFSNALKFRRNSVPPVIRVGAEKIRVESLRGIKNSDYFKIIVSDNGIGFDPRYADEIFLVFKGLHSHHEFEGTGVGLSICKKIVEKHNGSITAESKPGESSRFIIVLPEHQPDVVMAE